MQTALRGKPSVHDLGDVEIEAVVELGRARLTLREARALEAGHVITLEPYVGEPMQVRLNGHPFGEGETVIATDLMCLRLTRLEELVEAAEIQEGEE